MLKNSISKTGHRRAGPWGGWLRAATLTAGVALAATAHADVDAGATIPGVQSGSVSVTTPMRSSTLRQSTTRQQWISHKDCIDDMQLTFTTAVSGAMANKKLVAYVSRSVDDCLQNSTRNDPARCRHLTVVSSTESSAAPLVIVKAKALTELLGIPACGDDAADTGMSTEPVSLKFYFFLNPPPEDLVVGGANANFAIFADSGVDLWGPAPPTELVVTPGDEELVVSFSSGLDTSGDQSGLLLFTDDGSGVAATTTTSGGSSTTSAASSAASSGTSTSAGSSASSSSAAASGAGGASTSAGAGGAGGAGGASGTSAASSTATGAGGSSAGGAGGADAGPNQSTGVTSGADIDPCHPSPAVAKCTPGSFSLIPGEVPDSTLTGKSAPNGTTGTITGLTNGVALVVAVAAVDDVGNVGKLSELQCGTPAPVNSFLRVYECKGGFAENGCGFCSISGERGNSFAALVGGALVLLGLVARRSRRSRVTGGSRGAR